MTRVIGIDVSLLELLNMLVFDVLVGLLLWPFIKKHWKHHIDRDKHDSYM